MGKYALRCLECNAELTFEKFRFKCQEHNALVRSIYSKKRITFRDLPGIWKFYDWLPVEGASEYEGRSITYKSEGLAKELGLENLFISFSGYWPERGGLIQTCTFKELEAIATLQYAAGCKTRLVIASAGNTANAFAYIGSTQKFPVILVVPKKCLCDIWVPELDTSLVKTIIIEDGDYSDAISLAEKLSRREGLTYEGGARNIARRDGLATVLLDAVRIMKELPGHYFQAIGSGTGAIATLESGLRLLGDGRFGEALPKFHLSQNLPFIPMVRAWKEGRRKITREEMPKENVLDIVYARVLTNRYPPYSVRGGVYDALQSTKGKTYGITNEEAKEASRFFKEQEGIDILPAAAVAVASLIKAIEVGEVGLKDKILLNVTGGGKKRLKEDITLQELKADISINKDTPVGDIDI
ncbi:MAG: cysteate synthase [Candidatus Hydrothermarchaeales archaeon]